MVIKESCGHPNNAEEFDYIEEIYTPGVLEADNQAQCGDSDASDSKEVVSKLNSGPTQTPNNQAWHKINIQETESTTSMRRIDIVEETESEDEDDQHAAMTNTSISQSNSDKFSKFPLVDNTPICHCCSQPSMCSFGRERRERSNEAR